MLKWLYQLLIELTNHRMSSFVLKKFSQSKVSAILIPGYAKIYNINQNEMEKGLHNFATLQELFVRKLKPGQRVIDESDNSIVSPVDAVVEDLGTITASKEIIVKGKIYSISEMLANQEILSKYINGTFIILYLSPSHYHRIHSPISGVVTHQCELGNKSYPVNKLGLKYGKAPLSKNYRTITELQDNKTGNYLAVVKVGAMFVNSIETTHTSENVEKGGEIAYFSFGSTVVLLFEKDSVGFSESLKPSSDVKVGQVLGYFLSKKK